MASPSTSANNPVVVVGGTGLVGRNIITQLLANPVPSFTPIHSLSRRELSLPSNLLTSPNLLAHISKESNAWATQLPSSSAKLFISALGTTRGQAGSVAAQRSIDYDLNLELATAAKQAGVDTYVLISVAGAKANAFVPYTKMKGELEEAVQALGFRNTVIVRPGLIVGEREDTRVAEAVVRRIAGWAGALSSAAKDFWAQDADVIARAAVRAGVECVNGEREDGKKEGVWFLEQGDIVRLGKKA